MDWFTGVAVYITIWWVVLFMALPIGVRSQAETGEVTPGTDPGAPVIPDIGRKLLWTTIAAGVVWAILALVIAFDLVSLQRPLGGLVGPTG
jgi:predicted secreted protein